MPGGRYWVICGRSFAMIHCCATLPSDISSSSSTQAFGLLQAALRSSIDASAWARSTLCMSSQAISRLAITASKESRANLMIHSLPASPSVSATAPTNASGSSNTSCNDAIELSETTARNSCTASGHGKASFLSSGSRVRRTIAMAHFLATILGFGARICAKSGCCAKENSMNTLSRVSSFATNFMASGFCPTATKQTSMSMRSLKDANSNAKPFWATAAVTISAVSRRTSGAWTSAIPSWARAARTIS
mmetsp:Transcript_56616/g.157731  ORF Transcript_56616/g.157731 Transcript_56616/m.157731 type:complete len:249 (-) Transcript_56616:661-1407(-)